MINKQVEEKMAEIGKKITEDMNKKFSEMRR